jgi:type II secretory ATPase GspE/PulE/Tfp pilus assembly ATPase PilB-like protein
MAIMEKGREIRFEPDKDDYRIHLAIGDEVYEMVSPPAFIHFPVAQTVKAMAGLDVKNCDKSQEGRIEIKVPRTVETDVAVEPTEFGQKVVFRFLNNCEKGQEESRQETDPRVTK